MTLFYKNEIITSPDGIECKVLDESKIDFSNSCKGRKNKETLIFRANGNEKIETINSDGNVESTYVTNPGDAIFYNNKKDIYVPRDSNGIAWQFDKIIDYGYEITEGPYQINNNTAIKVKSTSIAYLLPEIIIIPTCIKDAWGVGAHQFLFKGATLKKDLKSGKVTGIDKFAFDETWEIIEPKKIKYKKIL